MCLCVSQGERPRVTRCGGGSRLRVCCFSCTEWKHSIYPSALLPFCYPIWWVLFNLDAALRGFNRMWTQADISTQAHTSGESWVKARKPRTFAWDYVRLCYYLFNYKLSLKGIFGWAVAVQRSIKRLWRGALCALYSVKRNIGMKGAI